MSKFDRKVQRNKKGYTFTKKEAPKEDESLTGLFKNHFNLKWVDLSIKTVVIFLIEFMAVTFLFIPLLMSIMDDVMAFVIGHGIISSFLICLTAHLLNKEKIRAKVFVVRYLMFALILGASSFVSMTLTSFFE